MSTGKISEASRFLQSLAGRFSQEELHELVPLLVLLVEPKKVKSGASPQLQQLLADFGTKVGVKPSSSPDDVRAAIKNHYADHPLNPALLAAVRDFIQRVSDPKLAAQLKAALSDAFEDG